MSIIQNVCKEKIDKINKKVFCPSKEWNKIETEDGVDQKNLNKQSIKSIVTIVIRVFKTMVLIMKLKLILLLQKYRKKNLLTNFN